jgi:hypothetical protein
MEYGAILAHVNICLEFLDIPLNMWFQVKKLAKKPAYQKMASKVIEELNITSYEWSMIFPHLLDYLRGGPVMERDKQTVHKLITHFQENQIEPKDWISIINEMDSQIQPLVYDYPISKLVPLINKELKPNE